MKYRRLLIAFAIAISLAVLGTVNPAMAAKQCDHKCLVDLMQKYVNALPKHDPTGLPFDKKIKFTENSDKTVDVLEVGKGMWENASSGPTEFQIYGADPEAQAAASLVVMKEKDKDVILGARIKLNKDGKIIEAEHLVVRSGMSSKPFSSMETLQKARPGFGEDIPKAERMKREDLIKIGYSYYDALTSEDGTRAPFAKECERRENGNISAGGPPRKAAPGGMTGFGGNAPTDCEGQLSAGVFSYITEIKPRIVVADVEKGLSIGFSMFRHDRTKRLPKDAQVLLTAEAKSIPLAHALSVETQLPYVVLRKSYKPYMGETVSAETLSITTGQPQTLYLDEKDIALIHGRKVVIVDDVISTGSTLQGMRMIIEKAGGTVTATIAVFTEGERARWKDIIALGHLPIFTADSK